MLMAPLVRRSWSLRGQTPILRQRGAHYQKVSAIAALCIPPTRDRIALYFRLCPNANVNAERAMDFLEHLQRQLRMPIVLIWDRFQAHKGEQLNECVPPRSAHLEYLPPYAPELNPVEYLWAYLKTNPLANAPTSIWSASLIELAVPPTPRNIGSCCCAPSSDTPDFLYASNRTLLIQDLIIARASADLNLASEPLFLMVRHFKTALVGSLLLWGGEFPHKLALSFRGQILKNAFG